MVVPNSDLSEADSPGDDGGMSGPPYHMDLQGSSDSDSELGDGDSVDLGGYQLLPQDPDQASDMEEPEEEQEASPGFMASPEEEPEEEQEASPGFMALPEAPSEWRPTEEMLRPAEPRPVEPLGQGHVACVGLTPTKNTKVKYTSAQIQAIQAAMAGFELPSSHLPPWAKDVPEEEWKQCLYRKLRGLAEQQS